MVSSLGANSIAIAGVNRDGAYNVRSRDSWGETGNKGYKDSGLLDIGLTCREIFV